MATLPRPRNQRQLEILANLRARSGRHGAFENGVDPAARALRLRSLGLNRRYGLGVPGSPARPPARPGTARPGATGATPGVDPLWGRANSIVEQMTSPLIQRLARQRVEAERLARERYAQHTGALEQGLTATTAPIGAAYGAAQQSAAATEEALAKRLRGEGEASGQSLAAKLAQINAPGGTGENQQVWRGAENAGFATGSADLQHLIGRGAEAQAYVGKLPQIARLEGNRALENTLSQQRADFAEAETGITDQAMQQAFELWQGLRGERREDQQNAQERIAAAQEQAARERMALRALRAAAVTNAEKMELTAREKALDRQLKFDIAKINAEVRLSTSGGADLTGPASQRYITGPNGQVIQNPNYRPPGQGKPGSRTGPANQQFITVNGKVVKNPNYVPPTGPGGGKPRLVPQGVVAQVRDSVNSPQNRNQWHPDILKKLQGSPRAVDGILNGYLNKVMSAYNLDEAQKKNLRRTILWKLNGRKWLDRNGREWTYTYHGK